MLSGMDKQRENGALLITACIVAAIRLRGEPIQPSPKLTLLRVALQNPT
jgi:hypothetical protein